MKWKIVVAFIHLFFVAIASQLVAQSATPRLSLITPRGAQRGTSQTFRFHGERLADVRQVFFYGTEFPVAEITPIDAKNVDIRIEIPQDAPLGQQLVQLRTDRGVSDFRSFFVGSMAELKEVEPNNDFEKAQSIEVNRTVNGTILAEDIDVFKINCQAGQRLSVEVTAIRLGYMFDSFISILNSEKFEFATSDDSFLGKQDGVLSITVPTDGEYFVVVREASYGGNPQCRYRLHVGDFPRPTVAYPAGGILSGPKKVCFLGDAAGTVEKNVDFHTLRNEQGIFVNDQSKIVPSPVPFRASNLENVIEIEPNNHHKDVTTTSSPPIAFNGIIQSPQDVDLFRFAAKKGQVFDIECYGRRIASGIDPVIDILNHKGRRIAGDDDSRRPDCYLRFNAPANGDYFVRVRDHLNRGDKTFVYRVELAEIEPRLTLSIPRSDRFSQLRQQIVIPRGNRFATLISANRENCSGPIELSDIQWPTGISIFNEPMAPNMNVMPVVFEAAVDAPIGGALVDLKAEIREKAVVGSFSLEADFALGNPNNSKYYTATVNKIACAVTEPAPFKIHIVQPEVPLVRDGSFNLKIVATRDPGFDAPITVQFPFRPPGIGTKPQIKIGKDKTEALYPINANSKAQLGRWPIYAIGQANVGGPLWVSSQLAHLEIAEPWVAADMNRVACEQGEPLKVFCKLNHFHSFEGEATAELLGVPPQLKFEPIKFNRETKELVFEVETNEKSPLGAHKGLFCRVTFIVGDEKVVMVAGRSQIQINPPKPIVADHQPKQPKAATAKPMSRLQQLRAAARQNAGGE